MTLFSGIVYPEDWQTAQICSAYRTTTKPRGLNPASFDTVPFIPMDAVPIAGSSVQPTELREGAKLSSGTYCEDGDLLLAKITPSFENGKQAFVALNGNDFAYATTEVIPLQAIPDKGVIEYLYAILLHPELRASLAGKMEGSTGRQRLSKDVLLTTLVPLPPTDEQRQIARVLATVQRAIEQQQAIVDATRELKRGLMNKLFTEGLRGEPQKQTEIGPVPESWDVVPLGDCLQMAQYGISVKGQSSGSYPILRMTNQRNGFTTSDNLQYVELGTGDLEKFRVLDGDIIFNRTNSFDLVGKTSIFRLQGNYVFASYLIRLRTITDRLLPDFLNFYFNQESTQKRLKLIATRGVSQSNISATRLRGFAIPLPSLSEQQEISESLSAVEGRLEIAETRHGHFKDLFKTLLHQLMTAQIRVRDLDLDALGVPALD